ncbi:hypothetical protein BDP27DRAFT_1336294 [Rhodocollybia butyracea]|uniref:Uncharacterized protein n=1 Tax=Rhodocollybia butyracea TaxID=206335 RepID=A0A9P5PIC8_9AGAR|nr:hypothetical protein BDP27DRAFT_1336294 [Rhodocollybia butyracea]
MTSERCHESGPSNPEPVFYQFPSYPISFVDKLRLSQSGPSDPKVMIYQFPPCPTSYVYKLWSSPQVISTCPLCLQHLHRLDTKCVQFISPFTFLYLSIHRC